MSSKERVISALWTALFEHMDEENLPPSEYIDGYEDKYSQMVLLVNEGGIVTRTARWSFDDEGWVDPNFSEGPYPSDYGYNAYKNPIGWIPIPNEINIPPKEKMEIITEEYHRY